MMMMDGPSPDFTGCCLMQRSQAKQIFIKCKNCSVIFHARCVGLDSVIARYLEEFMCISCEPLVGPTTFKSKRNEHRLDPLVIDDEMALPVQTGTLKFLQELRKRSFTSSDGIVRYMTGDQLTLQNFAQNGFNKPIFVSKMDADLGLLVPSPSFTFQDVGDIIGPGHEIEVIMSTRQTNTTMYLSEFLDHFKNRSDILNSLSLEFSQTPLSPYVEAPRIVRQLDWASQVWSKDYEQSLLGSVTSVQKYCIMSMKNSFTDFHIDFGGTSVWYHVLKGKKIFYIIPPTPANLAFYQTWQKSEKCKETFFGDQVDFTYQCTVEAGNTLFLPTGWIHAVLTPEDSLVFGGNFLHNLAIPMQLRVYEIERNTDTVDHFLYPYFESINWFAATHLVTQIAEYNSKQVCCPQFLLQGIKAITAVLKQWNQERVLNKGKHEPIPDTIEPQKLIKELNKEVRQAERIQNTVNPPKPERESKRKKKKPMDKDFVDITQSLSIQNLQPKSALKPAVKTSSKKLVIQTPPPAPAQPLSLKLTLPKPSTYPYMSHTNFASNSDLVDVKSEHVDGKSTVLRIKLVNRPAPSSSVYDFHDSDEEQLLIDERPKKLRAEKKVLGVTFSIKKHESTDMAEMEVAGEVDVESDAPKNGIDELLKASNAFGLETGAPARTKFGINNPVSPSNNTSDAIDGILAIGNPYVDEKLDGQANGVRNKRKLHPTTSTSHEEEEPMAKVHQDESYVYFSLDYSDGEEHVFKPRGKRKMDEAWNPKARVGHVLPKTDRPIREGTKKQSVEKCLEAAAAKRVGTAEPKRPYTRKKPKLMSVATPAASTSSSTVTVPAVAAAAAAAAAASGTPLPAKRVEPKVKKPKKGMATVKQRLGKKLKIHRMTF